MMRTLVALALVLSGCASTGRAASAPPPSTSSSSEESRRVDPEAVLARESPQLPRVEVHFPADTFNATVESNSAPTVVAEANQIYSISIPVGLVLPVTCQVYGGRIDPASRVKQVLDWIAADRPLRFAWLDSVEVAGEAAVMIVHAAYDWNESAGKGKGLVKIAVSARSDLSFLCLHDEPGYFESFKRWMRVLANSLKSNGGEPQQPLLRELRVMRVGETPLGFTELSLHLKDGARVVSTFNSVLIQKSESELSARESFSFEAADLNGFMTKAAYGSTIDHREVSNLVVRREGDSYLYGGTWEGAPLEGSFVSAEPLATDILLWQRVRELMEGDDEATLVQTYQPLNDPRAASVVTYRKAAASARAVEVTSGSLSYRGVVDTLGLMERFEVPAGANTVTVERVLFWGEPSM